MKIDVHSHYLPSETIREFSGTIEKTQIENNFKITMGGKVISPMPRGFFDAQSRIQEVKELGIDRQILSPTHHVFNYSSSSEIAAKISRSQNDGLSAVCRDNRQLFSGNATLPMQDSRAAITELDRSYSKLEIEGVEIGTNIAGKNLDNESLCPVDERIQELKLPIFVHPNDFLGPERLSKYYMGIVVGTIAETTIAVTSLLLGGVFKKFPGLKFIFCHGGGAIPYQISRIRHALSTRDEIKGSVPFDDNDLKNLFFDSVLFDRESMKFLIETWGADNVVFGTDYPFNMGNWKSHDILESLKFKGKEKIFETNVMGLYGRKA
jgi:aminocarboxymuconate-semialdehyde decarboxylase